MGKRGLILVLISCLALGGCGKTEEASGTDIDSVELKENQEIVIGQITSIIGNEIAYTVAEEVEMSDLKSSRGEKNSENKSGQSTNGQSEERQMPPEGEARDGQPAREQNSGSNEEEKQSAYSLTDETGTLTIPVGTQVITSLGNKTTFSRLSSGDVIKMILEKDSDGNQVVVGIWMV